MVTTLSIIAVMNSKAASVNFLAGMGVEYPISGDEIKKAGLK